LLDALEADGQGIKHLLGWHPQFRFANAAAAKIFGGRYGVEKAGGGQLEDERPPCGSAGNSSDCGRCHKPW
jgi:hypothetical protein